MFLKHMKCKICKTPYKHHPRVDCPGYQGIVRVKTVKKYHTKKKRSMIGGVLYDR
jgi:hypothetical protein